MPQITYDEWDKSPGYTRWAAHLDNIFTRLVGDLKQFAPGGRVLEIGSSLGYLLRALSAAGFEAEGIEPSRFAVEYATGLGLKVRRGYFERSIYGPSTFDVVILNHVLEHIPNPPELLGGVREVLKERGILVVGLPNFGSIEAQVLKGRWRFLMPQEHYLQFTPRTLSEFLTSNGFDLLQLKTTVNLTAFAYPWRELRRVLLEDKKTLIYYLIELLPSALEQAVGRGTGLEVIAVKRDSGFA